MESQTATAPNTAVARLSQEIQSRSRRVRYLINAIDRGAEPIPGDSADTRDALDMILQFCDLAREQILAVESMGEEIEGLTFRLTAKV